MKPAAPDQQSQLNGLSDYLRTRASQRCYGLGHVLKSYPRRDTGSGLEKRTTFINIYVGSQPILFDFHYSVNQAHRASVRDQIRDLPRLTVLAHGVI
jgi:hypothetical protein